jgi:hypothetical protein
VELSSAAGVGAVGRPVKLGLATFAFANAVSWKAVAETAPMSARACSCSFSFAAAASAFAASASIFCD